MSQPAIGFIGAGRAATGLAGSLAAHGYPVVAVASKGRASAERLAETLRGLVGGACVATGPQGVADAADLVFIATPDAEVEGVVAGVTWRAGQAVVHLGGGLTLEPLAAAKRRGADVGSFHPVQTFPLPSVEGSPPDFAGLTRDVAFGIEAEGPLFGRLAALAVTLGGFPVRPSPGDRALYHAGAVMACGLVAALFEDAVDAWAHAGIGRDVASRALWRLAEATLANVREQGATAITGPMVRGDFATSRGHVQALRAAVPDALAAYASLGWRCVQRAHEAGLATGNVQQWRDLFEEAR